MNNQLKTITILCLTTVFMLAASAACTSGTEEPSGASPPSDDPLADEILSYIDEIDPDVPATYGAPEKIVALGRSAIPYMLEQLDSPDLVTRYAAVYVLSRLAQPEDIPEMIKGLEDPNLSNRATIAATLLWLGDDRGIPVLEEAVLSDEMLSFSHPPELLADYTRRVLDELRPDLPALPEPDRFGIGFLASPLKAPLCDVTVTLSDCTINIVFNLQFSGAGATEALASTWASAIKDMWDGENSTKCCTTSVTVNTKVGGDTDPEYGQVTVLQMPQPGARHTSNMTLGGTVGEGGGVNDIVGEWDSNDTGAVAAHEAGHGLGVKDEYGADGNPTGDAVGESAGEGVPSIMAQTWKDDEGQKPEAKPRQVDQILAHHGITCPDECEPRCAPTPTPAATSTPPPPPLPPTPTPTSTPQAGEALAGFFVAFFQVDQDPGGHKIFVDLPIEQYLRVQIVREAGEPMAEISISAPAPFVDVIGTIENGVFTATGVGTVAGFPGISALFEGSITNPLVGLYTLGVDGGLPGGEAISYSVEGTKDAPLEEPSAHPDTELVETFTADLVDAMQSHDVTFLFDRLHPAILNIYGAEACQTYLGSIAGYSNIEVLQISGPGDWIFERDGTSTPIQDAYTIDANFTLPEGQVNPAVAHFALIDREMSWFTDCGDPLP